jgi:hypothetical protein
MLIEIGQKFVYRERNSVFEIAGPCVNGYWLVYYPLTGQYRKYTEQLIRAGCSPYVKAPKRVKRQPPVVVNLPGFPSSVEIDVNTGSVVCGCHKSQPGSLPILLAALRPLLKKVA